MKPDLEQALRRLAAERQGDYEPRTRHKDDNGRPLYINRLVKADSPYLLQHAHNPVNWYPWGDEAFAAAREMDRPVFLSIGYSTCHWCHVMEVESFDEPAVASLLNDSFISIKLDREQYPDIDEYYMTGVQIVSGQGGWPMSNFLLPDGRPFFGATYFPPGQFSRLLEQIAGLWSTRRQELEDSAENIAGRIRQLLQGRQHTGSLDLPGLIRSADRILEREDARRGGLAGAPKFPQEPLLLYFLEGAGRDRDLGKLAFLERALDAMGCGGIHDQAGGGFHRYSTDADWLVPHFEKMLYNQSQLALVYLRAWLLTGRHFFRRIVERTLDYVLREMTRPDSGFYSATDADSEEQEGLFFIWTLAQLRALLDADELAFLHAACELDDAGNFEGANILALQQPLEALAAHHPLAEFETRLDSILAKLLAARQSRIAPLRDDKMITGWSAEMATALAWAGAELEVPRYLDAAQDAVEAIWTQCFDGQSALQRISLNGATSIPAQLEDYARLCEALITLFDRTGEGRQLARAAQLMDQALQLFWNAGSGGFYLSRPAVSGPELVRSSSAGDGAIRSAYGVAVECLAMLARRQALLERFGYQGGTDFVPRFHQAVRGVSGELGEYAPGHVTLINAIARFENGTTDPVQYGADGRLRVHAGRAQSVADQHDLQQVQLTIRLDASEGFKLADEAPGLMEPPAGEPVTVNLTTDERHWRLITVSRAGVTASRTYKPSSPQDSSREVTVLLQRSDRQSDALAQTIGLNVRIQLCNESLCLAPANFSFRVLVEPAEQNGIEKPG